MEFEPHWETTAVKLQCELTAYQITLGNYWIDFIPGGPELVITFESGGTGGSDSLRDCWGLSYLTKRNFSVLGIKWKALDWYRGVDLHAFFRSDNFQNFSRQFTRKIFAGGSMGGYAALAFSQVLPGALVIAHNPQTTLDSRIVPWDKRFEQGIRQDWTGDFADAALAVPYSRRIYVTYDPFDIDDRRHVARLSGTNIVHLKIPFTGHASPRWLAQLKILSQITDMAIGEELTEQIFSKLIRRRRTISRYYLCMYLASKKRSYKELALTRGLQIAPIDMQLYALAFKHYFNQKKYESCVFIYQQYHSLLGLSAPEQREIHAMAGIALRRVGRPPSTRCIRILLKLQDVYLAVRVMGILRLLFRRSFSL